MVQKIIQKEQRTKVKQGGKGGSSVLGKLKVGSATGVNMIWVSRISVLTVCSSPPITKFGT